MFEEHAAIHVAPDWEPAHSQLLRPMVSGRSNWLIVNGVFTIGTIAAELFLMVQHGVNCFTDGSIWQHYKAWFKQNLFDFPGTKLLVVFVMQDVARRSSQPWSPVAQSGITASSCE